MMGEVGSIEDPLAGWDPARRAALERLWATFAGATRGKKSLSDELIAERRMEAEAEDQLPRHLDRP